MKAFTDKSAARSIAQGAIGFAVVSAGGFSVWAFGGRWFYVNAGEAGLYAACAAVFGVLAGLLLHPLMRGERKVLRLYRTFVPAFVAYAVVWSVCWFALKSRAGEWAGSLAGCVAFAWVAGALLGSLRGLIPVALALFATHSAGYFAGSFIYDLSQNPPGFLAGLPMGRMDQLLKLSWGAAYGLGFGAGIGYAYHVFQGGLPERRSPGLE